MKECSTTGQNSEISRFLQPTFPGIQTQQSVDTYLGPELPEQIPYDREIQNGKARDNKGVGNVQLGGRLLPHTNQKPIQKKHSSPGSILPIQDASFWSVHSTHRVHGSGEGGQTDGITQGYKIPPVPRRLEPDPTQPVSSIHTLVARN